LLKHFLQIKLKGVINRNPGFQILQISYFVGLITLFFKLLYVIRDLIIAWTFGRSESLEAFILAFLIPYSLINALADSLTLTFLPRFIELRENGQYKVANEIYSELLGILLLISSLLIILLVVSYPLYSSIIAAGFSKQGLSTMNFLLYFTALAAFLHGVAVLWKGILNAKEKFIQSSVVSIVTPLVSVGLLIYMNDLGIWVLSLGLLFGGILELFILGILLKKQKFRLLPGLSIFSIKLRISLKDWWRVLMSLSLFNSMGLINGFMAARRPEIGGLAILNYGKKIVTLPNDISAITYSAVLIPYLSRVMASNDRKRFLRVLDRWLLLIFATTIPIVIAVLFLAKFIVAILYERGAFTPADTENVSFVLMYYILQLPFFVSFYVLLRVLPIIRKNTSTVFLGLFGVIITIIFNYIFIGFLGTYGIALSTSCVYFCLSICAYSYIRGMLTLPTGLEKPLTDKD
jgi:putative peptidoglycan lipid II flippase